jgi:hypothetical protein
MNRCRCLMLWLLACGVNANAATVGFFNGHALREHAVEHQKKMRGDDTANIASALFFHGYVLGVIDGSQGVQTRFCPTPPFMASQVGAIASAYLGKHPELWGRPGNWLVLESMAEAFPCRK